jgi:hypothetical protein
MATTQSTKRQIMGGGLLFMAAMSTGCATASQRFVAFPAKGQDAQQAAYDQNDCDMVAKGHKQDDLTAAAMGGVTGGLARGAVGAVGGAIIGSVFGRAGQGAQALGLAGLATGALIGVVEGLAANQARYYEIYRACLAARGYTTGG